MDDGRDMSVRVVIIEYQFISSKLIPIWIIANADLTIGLILSNVVFNNSIIGSVTL